MLPDILSFRYRHRETFLKINLKLFQLFYLLYDRAFIKEAFIHFELCYSLVREILWTILVYVGFLVNLKHQVHSLLNSNDWRVFFQIGSNKKIRLPAHFQIGRK